MDSSIRMVWYNKQNIFYFSEDCFCLSKQHRPCWKATLCGISSGSSLFAKVTSIQRVKCHVTKKSTLCWINLRLFLPPLVPRFMLTGRTFHSEDAVYHRNFLITSSHSVRIILGIRATTIHVTIGTCWAYGMPWVRFHQFVPHLSHLLFQKLHLLFFCWPSHLCLMIVI